MSIGHDPKPRGLNILVYSGDGAGPDSISHAINTLQAFLGHNYAVRKADAQLLKTEPWESSTALIVFPGGRDKPYVRDLGDDGVARLREWVINGGRYIGFCAGGYFGSSRCEFEPNTALEVIGDRKLRFYPGTCLGAAYPGYNYTSHDGARAVQVGVHRRAFIRQDPLVSGIVPDSAYLYFNGGGLFVGAHELDYRDGNRCGTDRDLLLPKQQQQQQQHEGTIVDVLADFPPDVPNPWNRSEILANATAIVGCRLGRGRAVLTGVHPEYNTLDLDPADYTTPYNRNLVEVLLAGDSDRKRLLYAMFRYLGFEPRRPEDTLASWYDLNGVPLQTPTFLTPIIVGGSDGGSADFGTKLKRLVDPNTGTFKDTGGDVAVVDPQDCGQYLDAAPIDITSSTPTVITCPPGVYPCNKATPHFNMADFAHQVQSKGLIAMGSWAMYTEVVTSTQTFLEKNLTFQRLAPSGLINIASVQTLGRGRDGNMWISPSGCLQSTLLIRHPMSPKAPIVFVQYIMGLAVVEAVRSRPGYEDIPLRLKWPNDIYADASLLAAESSAITDRIDTSSSPLGSFVKIGGVLVTSSFENNQFTLLIGTGVNTNNAMPTTSINQLITAYSKQNSRYLEPISMEDMLASILQSFENFYRRFLLSGIEPLLGLYYKRWLHSGQEVCLKDQDYLRVRIVGISADNGMLLTESVHQPAIKYSLQPNGNSFDMMSGLIGRKS